MCRSSSTEGGHSRQGSSSSGERLHKSDRRPRAPAYRAPPARTQPATHQVTTTDNRATGSILRACMKVWRDVVSVSPNGKRQNERKCLIWLYLFVCYYSANYELIPMISYSFDGLYFSGPILNLIKLILLFLKDLTNLFYFTIFTHDYKLDDKNSESKYYTRTWRCIFYSFYEYLDTERSMQVIRQLYTIL